MAKEALSSLQSQVASLRGALVSKKNFPAPATPAIPDWQKAKASGRLMHCMCLLRLIFFSASDSSIQSAAVETAVVAPTALASTAPATTTPPLPQSEGTPSQ